MAHPLEPLIVIPARLASTRLPDKPLAEINGAPMIVRVLRSAEAASVGPVVVACGDAAIAEAVIRSGGRAVMTDPALRTGTDRVSAAAAAVDPHRRHDVVVNLQGDTPDLAPEDIRAALSPLADPAVDMATVAAVIRDPVLYDDPNTVKAVAAIPSGARIGRALYFSRARVPSGDGPFYHHFGLYAFRRSALARFPSLPEGVLEKRERLEQLRALEAGLNVWVALIDRVPLEVNTPEDLARARRLLPPLPAR
jgi:3-deoxy-manno-octulosonate cytidylyltransferase (CMP-KDO synthetase)